MQNQDVTIATLQSITLLTCDLPAAVLPLARIALAHITDQHLPDNIKAGLERLFTGRPLENDSDPDPVYQALGDLVDIAISQDQTPEAKARVMRARDVLIEEGALGDAMAAMNWLREVQALAAADGVAAPLLH